MQAITLFWFRRDLRLQDNAGLYHALKSNFPVLPLFIFDTEILDELDDPEDARVAFLHQRITELQAELEHLGSSMLVRYGKPAEVWPEILQDYLVAEVYTNHDYEPRAIQRDEAVQNLLAQQNIPYFSFKDQVIFEKLEVTKLDGKPYTVFTPYSRMWKNCLASQMETIQENGIEQVISFFLKPYPTEKYYPNFWQTAPPPLPALSAMGFQPSSIAIPPTTVSRGLIKQYDKTRDFPYLNGTSRLGIHFRFGTISIREKARRALELNETFLNELIWRDFYAQILFNFPHVAQRSFRPEYDQIEWRNDEDEFEKWCAGKTGYPIVDAGLRELNATGYMHNRVRMITASFLTKHLLIDWRWGEAYFAKKLLDYDLASNNGGWQWAAGCGTDAAPYFRVFSPAAQQEKFDPEYKYVRKWVPEYGTDAYPKPIVDHKFARERCLEVYKAALKGG
ncbi:cryptochrome/photolyase family protein [Haliscomenobacter hydrossis]|uniref:Deoxyribodipyrimidine photo-lyase n=1 Tax=Haliscomenobacter hydrossis (strain ATCC 27775 / DSM 1100 / LMG 10767 / O) TaxID=760192 RepID=F4KX28_HALH1|nr:deoxyribodipyrimidine photo-lyase [Haliscomenobacter hydrossis]AEE48256.1 Deoxyribodipyrimidine photo-lyase [Haliscomenobacter hydrossis DSM 1100]